MDSVPAAAQPPLSLAADRRRIGAPAKRTSPSKTRAGGLAVSRRSHARLCCAQVADTRRVGRLAAEKAASGVRYYGYRFYNANLGRFINRDPIEEAGGINLYGFCTNDGINHWDYLGQDGQDGDEGDGFDDTDQSSGVTAPDPTPDPTPTPTQTTQQSNTPNGVSQSGALMNGQYSFDSTVPTNNTFDPTSINNSFGSFVTKQTTQTTDSLNGAIDAASTTDDSTATTGDPNSSPSTAANPSSQSASTAATQAPISGSTNDWAGQASVLPSMNVSADGPDYGAVSDFTGMPVSFSPGASITYTAGGPALQMGPVIVGGGVPAAKLSKATKVGLVGVGAVLTFPEGEAVGGIYLLGAVIVGGGGYYVYKHPVSLPNYNMMRGSGGFRGERNWEANDPKVEKGSRQDPNNPNRILKKDQNGKWISKPKPPGWGEPKTKP